MHKPIRVVNQLDLIKMRTCLKKHFSYTSSSVAASSSKKQSKTRKTKTTQKLGQNRRQKRRRRKMRFMGLKVILAPYGISGRLLGYLSNDSVESRLTCDEWRQFYPLKLLPNMPNVFCIGVDHNRVKLFYPNCFVYVVMDQEGDRSDDDDDDDDDVSLIEQAEVSASSSGEEADEEEEEEERSPVSDDDWLSDELMWDDYEEHESNDSNEDDESESTDSSTGGGGGDSESDCPVVSVSVGDEEKTRKEAVVEQPDVGSNDVDYDLGDDEADAVLLEDIDDPNTVKTKSNKTRAEMDSLDLTIDSVARNFGTNLANTTSPNTTAVTQSNQPGTNRSILSISQSSPLSVTAISSPTSMLVSPSQLNSPGRQSAGFKRQKSSSGALANRSLSNLTSTGVVDQLPPSVSSQSGLDSNRKKRKKTLDSSSSDVSLNSPAMNKSASGGKALTNLLTETGAVRKETAAAAAASGSLSASMAAAASAVTMAKKVRLNLNHSTVKANARVRQRRRRMMRIERKERMLMRQAQFFSVQKLIDQPYVSSAATMNAKSNQVSRGKKSSSQANACCQYKYNMYKNLNNQV